VPQLDADGRDSIVKRPGAEVVSKLLSEQHFDIWLIINHEKLSTGPPPPSLTRYSDETFAVRQLTVAKCRYGSCMDGARGARGI
jgi:hypothetical protein